jgi:preprotein translocase subunit SecG
MPVLGDAPSGSQGMPTEAKWALSLLIAAGVIFLGWKYVPVLVALHIMVCFVLILVIMLQSGNAADLAGAFGGAGSQTAFGPRGAATFLSKATTWCAIVFMVTSLTLSVKRTPEDVSIGGSSVLEQTTKTTPAPAPAKPAGALPSSAPGQTPMKVPAPPPGSQKPAPQK